MSTALLLSSSPPRMFARSPTSADSSPYLPSPTELFGGGSQSPKRFKSNAATRDGFAGGFSTARSLLAVKHGAENQQLGSQHREKFKALTMSLQTSKPKFSTQAKSPKKLLNQPQAQTQVSIISKKTENTSGPESGEVQHDAVPSLSSTDVTKALPRRTDWTPLKEVPQEIDVGTSADHGVSTSFPNGLMGSFGLGDALEPVQEVPGACAELPKPVKRRKVDLVEARPSLYQGEVIKIVEKQLKPPGKKRAKSPAKKPMTITHLATSHYFGKVDTKEDSPMLQYLNSTQMRDATSADIDDIEVLPKNVKPKMKRSSTRKGQSSRSRLLSPKSAIQSLVVQETVFGSASQLVGDEQPLFEPNLASEAPSPERTQAISIASTTPPTNRGTSRFLRTRNLWAAAGRDEDNALLHVEAVDLFDTPCMKEVFAGKDALVAPAQSSSTGQQQITRANTFPSRMGNSPPSAIRRTNIIDADNLHSPLFMANGAARALHTKVNNSNAGTATEPEVSKQSMQQNRKRVSAASPQPKPRVPPKPSYAGLETIALQKQLKTYGFKPVKKREKMIELLEMCWEAKYGKQQQVLEAEEDHLKHSDFLSKVHDISSRPEPKVKKPRKRTEAQADDKSPTKQTKRRKQANSTAQETATEPQARKPRKARSKKLVLSEEVVDLHSEDKIEDDVPEPAVVPSKDIAARSQIPQPTQPPHENDGLHGTGYNHIAQDHQKTMIVERDLGVQIQAAILRHSETVLDTDRDHVRDPTWHEKILMYDPIILEDLTAWLNTEGLNEIKEDREVSAPDVRTWCESKGICCLWKGGWRGQTSKANDD